jgi:hypothetical protein
MTLVMRFQHAMSFFHCDRHHGANFPHHLQFIDEIFPTARTFFLLHSAVNLMQSHHNHISDSKLDESFIVLIGLRVV